jgi:transcriptional regulator with XRE-family HTH domain
MKNIELAKRIKEQRLRKGFSQDELAEKAQINLRTVQRIENGETEPRGDTLQRLASALGLTPDELIDWAEQEDQGYLVLLNLSALSFLVFPLLGSILPLALWVLKKDKIKNLNEAGKKLLNFQFSWSLLPFLFYGSFILTKILHLPVPRFSFLNLGGAEMLLVFSIPLLYGINIVYIMVNAFRSYKGKKVFYQPAIPFMR